MERLSMLYYLRKETKVDQRKTKETCVTCNIIYKTNRQTVLQKNLIRNDQNRTE